MAAIAPKYRIGVADDPSAQRPTLHECLETALEHAPALMAQVVQGLTRGVMPGPQQIPAFKLVGVRNVVLDLGRRERQICAVFAEEFAHLVWKGGGKDQVQAEVLRYEDLQLLGDAELDQSIEIARALQEARHASEDVLPALDALISTMLGWRTIQPGLNPLRPEAAIRALQATLAREIPDAQVRELLVTPSGGLMGVQLRRLYKDLADWLRSTGVEPAEPLGATAAFTTTQAVRLSPAARTLLTLDRLRKLLAGDFDQPAGRAEFLHTVPASMTMLEELQQVDTLVARLEKRGAPAPAPVAMTEDETGMPRVGRQLGREVLRLLFESLAKDARLLPAYKRELMALEPAVQLLAEHDSRVFSDRTHPARQLLERMTQRSLGYPSETSDGWPRFLRTVQASVHWVLGKQLVDADTFAALLARLEQEWADRDRASVHKREEAARALLHAEQRALLATRLAEQFLAAAEGQTVAGFVLDFLRGPWAQVVAEDRLSCAEGVADPHGYAALVPDLLWSAQVAPGQRRRARRLAQLLPGMLPRLRAGMASIEWPPELVQQFMEQLRELHEQTLRAGEEAAARAASVGAGTAEAGASLQDLESSFRMSQQEAQDSGWIEDDRAVQPGMAAARDAAAAAQPLPGIKPGAWADLDLRGEVVRVQLTWASPHGTLFMFTSMAGTAHSMSRRTLDRLLAHGRLRVVAERPVVDDALDEVAQAALFNSLGPLV